MRVLFVCPEYLPDRLVAEVEIHFDAGLLAGTKLAGFALWRGRLDGELHVTLPARAIGVGCDRKFVDYLRPITHENDAAIRALKQFIVDAYQAQAAQPVAARAAS